MVFGEGSKEACGSLLYLRWKWKDRHDKCRLGTGKTQVAPQVKITIPRMELVAALHSLRFTQRVRESLGMPISSRGYFTDTSAVLAMLKTESGQFKKLVGTT
jgi:hypothetical protein